MPGEAGTQRSGARPCAGRGAANRRAPSLWDDPAEGVGCWTRKLTLEPKAWRARKGCSGQSGKGSECQESGLVGQRSPRDVSKEEPQTKPSGLTSSVPPKNRVRQRELSCKGPEAESRFQEWGVPVGVARANSGRTGHADPCGSGWNRNRGPGRGFDALAAVKWPFSWRQCGERCREMQAPSAGAWGGPGQRDPRTWDLAMKKPRPASAIILDGNRDGQGSAAHMAT